MKSTTPGEIRIFLLATLLLTTATIANAQQPAKLPRIGVLLALSHSAIADRIEAFRQGLRDLGYMEGKNIALDYQHADGKFDRLPDLAAELVRLKVDVIVTGGPTATRPAKAATSSILSSWLRIPIRWATGSSPLWPGPAETLPACRIIIPISVENSWSS
jgi:putative ABC transport system substrate-binding protein